MRRLRVLISSHEFKPYAGSERAVGWNISTQMAKFHDVTVLCADGPPDNPNSYRNALSQYVEKQGAIPGLRVVFVEQPPRTLRYDWINSRLKVLTHGSRFQPLLFLGLDGWHRAAFRAARTLGFENFDVVHQLTPISFLSPGYLWKSDVPFFWGPISGMYNVPSPFARSGGMKSYLFQTLRSLNITRETRSVHFKRVVRKAKRIWTVAQDEFKIIDSIAGGTAVPMIESSPPPEIVGCVRQYDSTRPLKLCWSGLHDNVKALPLLLHAIAHLPEPGKVALNVLGAGPETKRWKVLAEKLSIPNITWLGPLPYHEALQSMGKSDVFVHSSIKEGTPTVVLEAIAWGLPVICHDICGMTVAVNERCGIKVPLETPERSIAGFHSAIERLLRSPGMVQKLSEGALVRASQLSLEAKVKEISEAYVQFTE